MPRPEWTWAQCVEFRETGDITVSSGDIETVRLWRLYTVRHSRLEASETLSD